MNRIVSAATAFSLAFAALVLFAAVETRTMRGTLAAAPGAAWAGRWLAEDIAGGGVLDRVQTVLEIGADGRISGSGGCNRYFGTATVAGEAISFGPIGTTQMACPPAVMNQESKYIAALREARGWRHDAARRKLTLVDAGGRPLVVFARM